jgi:DNA topoisomerase-2
MKKISKCGIVDKVIKLAEFKENASLKKTDGKKQIKLKGIPKLDDANRAGSKDSFKCSLILTEGDSAKAFAMAGVGVVGRDHYGVFPLKGKLLNVREASVSQINNNDEINHLKQIIGLKQGVDYSDESNFSQLRYGRIIILTDQDVDGSHIKGLVMNFLHVLWPELLQKDGFVTSLATPIVKLFKGKEVETFYNLTEYEDFIQKLKEKNQAHLWKTKYYKGLGTSTSAEAKEYFNGIEDKLIKYFYKSAMKAMGSADEESDEESESDDESVATTESSTAKKTKDFKKSLLLDNDDDAITLAFDKERSDDRKYWLLNYNKNNILTYDMKEISYCDFIHKDLIHFSNDDTLRSIPSIVDGFKPSQRKIFYGASLRGLDKTEVKVAQLAGFVSDKAAYHHGEASLTGAITGMAQDFVGSNNVNVLKPNGQFGTRIKGGKDAASPRYIWTEFSQMTNLIFRKEDEPILNYLDEDGLRIEPEYYLPIIPMVLINGAEGIGTGFSTKCPQFNPKDIINNLVEMIDSSVEKRECDYKLMTPWWSLYEGSVEKINDHQFVTHGCYEVVDNNINITELPVGEWTSNYKEFLEKWLDKESNKKNKSSVNFLGYTDNNTDKRVHFQLEFNDGYVDKADIEKDLKLRKNINLTNIHLYNMKGTIKKYRVIKDIMDEFFIIRLAMYVERKKHILNKLKNELDLLSYKVKFILAIIDKDIKINNKTKSYIESKLEKLEFPRLARNHTDTEKNYNYLLGMNLWSLSYEKVEELKKQMKEKETEYNTIKKNTPEMMWKDELLELLEKYTTWYQIKLDEHKELKGKVEFKKSSKRRKKKVPSKKPTKTTKSKKGKGKKGKKGKKKTVSKVV